MADPRDIEIKRLKDELHRAQTELDDVLESTKDIEAQLEQDVAQTEKQLLQLRRKNEELTYDIKDWKDKYANAQRLHEKELSSMRKELDSTTSNLSTVRAKLRDEELKHDNLAQHERIVNSSYETLEKKYHEALERNVELESEVIAYEEIRIEHQRLKDELRDVNSELLISRTQQVSIARKSLDAIPAPETSSPSGSEYSHQKESFFVDGTTSSPDITQRAINRSASVRNIRSLTSSMQTLREKMKAAVNSQAQSRPSSSLRRLSELHITPLGQESPERSPSKLGHRPPSSGLKSPITYQRPSSSSSDKPMSRLAQSTSALDRRASVLPIPTSPVIDSSSSQMRPPSRLLSNRAQTVRRTSNIPSPLKSPGISSLSFQSSSIGKPTRRQSNFGLSSPTPFNRLSASTDALSSPSRLPNRRTSTIPRP